MEKIGNWAASDGNVSTLTQPWLLLLVALLAIVLWVSLQRWYERWLRRRRWVRAQTAETMAPKLLRELGYSVLGAQIEGSYELLVDGRPLPIGLRADYVVTRDDRTYVAEVKSGNLAPRLGNPATRRQLLEYLVAFDVDGVLLVDGESKQVHEVVFPLEARAVARSGTKFLAPAIVALFLLAMVAAWRFGWF